MKWMLISMICGMPFNQYAADIPEKHYDQFQHFRDGHVMCAMRTGIYAYYHFLPDCLSATALPIFRADDRAHCVPNTTMFWVQP